MDQNEAEEPAEAKAWCPECKGWGFLYGGTNFGNAWSKDCPKCLGKDNRALKYYLAKDQMRIKNRC